MELVTGFAGTAHIDPVDTAHVHAASFGPGAYLLDTQNKLAAELETANKLVIDKGDLMIQGHHFTVIEPEDVALQSGVSGQKRNALVCAKYNKDANTGVETGSWVVKYGDSTTGTPTDPTVTTGDILDGGALVHEEPVYRIEYDGITPSDPILLLDEFTNNASFRDSISLMPKCYIGSKVFSNVTGTSVRLFTAEESVQNFGRTLSSASGDYVGVFNSDSNSCNAHIDGAQKNNSGDVYATFDRSISNASVRINYLVVMNP